MGKVLTVPTEQIRKAMKTFLFALQECAVVHVTHDTNFTASDNCPVQRNICLLESIDYSIDYN